MKTLIVSDRLNIDHLPYDTEVVTWDERPSVEGFPLVVLDLYFGDPTDEGFVKIDHEYHRFYEMGAEVALCLKADGIVIACMGPIANTIRAVAGAGYRNNTYSLKRERLKSEQVPVPERESSYDWLDQGLLSHLELGHQYVRSSAGITWHVPQDRFYRLRESFKSYVETFAGVEFYGEGRATITYRIEEGGRWDSIQNVIQTHPQILAIAEHTKLPVAMSFNYNYFGGQLVLMPPIQVPEDQGLARLLVSDLKDLGEWLYSINHVKSEERPSWVDDYLAPHALVIQQEISDLEHQVTALTEQKETYHTLLPLLYGTGTELEDAVERFITSGDEAITVTKSEPGAHIDFFVLDSSGRGLAIEVTGVKGPLRHSDGHWADFLNYMPEHNAKNEATRVERIVLVVNTFRDLPFAERDRNSDMTAPVKKTATDNGICVVRSGDLYSLWLKTLDGMSKQEVFDTLFATEGIYDPPAPQTT